MHLFKNKTKDVKQFLQEMKANKTNRSSNQHSLQKSNKSANSSSHSQDLYHSNSIGNLNKQNFQRRSNMNSVTSRQSNQSNQGSINTNNIRFNPGGNKFYPSPPQPINQRPGYDQPHFRMQEPRYLSSQKNQYHDYIEPVSQSLTYDHDMANNPSHYYPNQRRLNSFDDTRSFHNQPYHNLSQPIRSQNFPNTHDSYGLRKNSVEPFSMSQNSNTTIYSNSQQYQNAGKNYQNFQKALFKPEPTNFITQSSNHYSQKVNQFELPKNHFNSSQQLYNNRFNQQKTFTSQVSNFDYEMQEICEAEAGLSTQKDSPAKLTEFFSKNKDSNSKDTPIKKIIQPNIFEILEDDIHASQSNEKIQQAQNHLKSENQKISHRNLNFVEKNVELKHFPLKSDILNEDYEKTKKIRVSESQRLKLNRSFHQIHSSYMEVDRLFKQTSILFNNIQRASDEFNKKIKIKESDVKYLSENVKNEHQKMEIQSSLRDDQTLKKQIYQNKNTRDFHNQKTFKKEKRVNEIEI